MKSTKSLDDYAAYTITQLQIIIAACQTRFGFILAGRHDSRDESVDSEKDDRKSNTYEHNDDEIRMQSTDTN